MLCFFCKYINYVYFKLDLIFVNLHITYILDIFFSLHHLDTRMMLNRERVSVVANKFKIEIPQKSNQNRKQFITFTDIIC